MHTLRKLIKLQKPGMVVHTYNPSNQEAEPGRSRVQGHSWQYSKQTKEQRKNFY
jgi:hypothetical protein